MTKMLIDGAAAESGPATTAHPSVLADAARRGVPVLDVVVPVYNEQARMRKGFALGRIPVAEVAAELRTGREQVVPPRGTLHQLAVFGAIGVVSTLAHHRDRQHRRQPEVQLRRPRAGRPCPPPR